MSPYSAQTKSSSLNNKCKNLANSKPNTSSQPSNSTGHRRVNSAPAQEFSEDKTKASDKTTSCGYKRGTKMAKQVADNEKMNVGNVPPNAFKKFMGMSQSAYSPSTSRKVLQEKNSKKNGSCPILQASESTRVRSSDRNNNKGKNNELPFKRSPANLMPFYARLSHLDILKLPMDGRWSESLEAVSFIPEHDLRILANLALKKRDEDIYRDVATLAQNMWDTEQQASMQKSSRESEQWYQILNERHAVENMENQKRLQESRKRCEEAYLQMEQALRRKDRKVQENIEKIKKQRCKEREERLMWEESHRNAVIRALRNILEKDEKHRMELQRQQQRRLENAFQKQKKAKETYRKQLIEFNRIEEHRRQERLYDLEQQAESNAETIQQMLQKKEERAREKLEDLALEKEMRCKRTSEERMRQQHNAQMLKKELDCGLERWRNQVFMVQHASMERARKEVQQQIQHRKKRLKEEREHRQQSHKIIKDSIQAAEKSRYENWRMILSLKAARMDWLDQERQRALQESRMMAYTTAQLRNHVKRTLSPETFDRKVARAELEIRLVNRPRPHPAPHMHASNIYLG